MSGPQRIGDRALELRRAFDRSFAEVPAEATAPSEDLLAIRVGAHPYAFRLSEISGLFAEKIITRFPNAVPEFLGIAAFRGIVVPVYDLRALLGYSSGGVPRWLVIAAASPVALAFDVLDGHERAGHADIAAEAHAEAAQPHVREVLRTAAGIRPIVSVASIIEVIRQRTHQGVSHNKG